MVFLPFAAPSARNKRQPDNVLIEGRTDNVGSNSANQGLSDRRAYAVRTALNDMGISSDRIRTRGYADAYPVGQRHDGWSSIESSRGNNPFRRKR
ncbi:MAG: OmpA family protein [Methylobacter tundripaludum]|nr:OmpA family protein [Methylobacter tundripaludum]